MTVARAQNEHSSKVSLDTNTHKRDDRTESNFPLACVDELLARPAYSRPLAGTPSIIKWPANEYREDHECGPEDCLTDGQNGQTAIERSKHGVIPHDLMRLLQL